MEMLYSHSDNNNADRWHIDRIETLNGKTDGFIVYCSSIDRKPCPEVQKGNLREDR